MGEFKSDSSLKRVLNNGVFSAIQFGAYALSGIILTPFLLKKFGAASFGLIALAGFLTQYVGMIAGCVASSISRFLNIALNKNDWIEAREIFSTALVGNVVIILLQVPFFVLGVWKLHWFIDFPAEQAFNFRLLVSCNVGIFLITILTGVLGTPIQASNRLDLGMKMSVVFQIIRLLLLFGLINWLGAQLWIIGVVDLLLSLGGAGATFLIYRHLARSLVFRWGDITVRWVRPVLGMASFMLISSLANSLFFKTDVWMLNRFVGAEIAGIYAALLIWPNFLIQIVSRLSSLVGPTYFIDYARNDLHRILRNTLFAEKLISFCAILTASLFIFFGENLLSVWMGRSPSSLENRLLTLFFLTASFSVCSDAVWRIFQVFNKPKVPGIIALGCGILNIVLSISLIRFGAGVYGVVAGTMVSSLLLKAIFQPWYAARLLNQNPIILWSPIIISLSMCLFALGVKHSLGMLQLDFWYICLAFIIAGAALGLFALTTEDERILMRNYIKNYISKD